MTFHKGSILSCPPWLRCRGRSDRGRAWFAPGSCFEPNCGSVAMPRGDSRTSSDAGICSWPARRSRPREGRRRGGRRRHSLPALRIKRRPSPLSDDQRVVALDPAVRGVDEEVEPDSEGLAVLGDRLPVELDDVAEPLGVVAPRKLSPSEPTQCWYALAARASIASYPCASASPVGQSSAPRAARSRKPREPGAGS
jgi:hypothetical protein